MAKKQRIYTPEFRQQMVEPVRAGRKYAELEKEFGCTGWLIRQWDKSSLASSRRCSGFGNFTFAGWIQRRVNGIWYVWRGICSESTRWQANRMAKEKYTLRKGPHRSTNRIFPDQKPGGVGIKPTQSISASDS